jgi:hypothetical protein
MKTSLLVTSRVPPIERELTSSVVRLSAAVAAVMTAAAPLEIDSVPKLIVPPPTAANVSVPPATSTVELPQLTNVNGNDREPLKIKVSPDAVSETVTPVKAEAAKLICTPFWLAVILPPLALRLTAPAAPRLMSRVEPAGTAKFSAITVAVPWALPSLAETVNDPGVEPSVASPVPLIELPLPVIPQVRLGELMALPN